jgi:class 3 adenylate cyclase/tetratricopeptide (TPR) repeat protein
MADPDPTKIEQLRRTLAALEGKRSVLGPEVVETALVVLRNEIKALEAEQMAPSEVTEERRILTILFTDIVGSTSIAEKLDPEDWREMLKNVHQSAGDLIHKWDGEVLQHLGDGLLAVFGAKVSRERDSENAVRAALDIQAAIPSLPINPPLEMRIGIHTGLVVIGELGSLAKREFAATGDAMNHADRLQKAAPAGGVLISDDTHRYVRGLFEMTLQPPLKVKGKEKPIQTYLVQRARTRPYRMVTRGIGGVKTRTIGRKIELDKIAEAFVDSLHHRRTGWVQLIGDPGVGKTRLLMDAAENLETYPEDLLWFRACAFEGDSKLPFSLIRRMWFDHFQIREDLPTAEAEAAWVEGFRNLPISNFEETAHVLGLLVGLSFQESPYLRALRRDPAQAKGRAFVLGRELFASVQNTKPVVILIEDLQWVDPSSWEYIHQTLIEESTQKDEGNSLFVLATARPEWHPPDDLHSHAGYTQLDLRPLVDEDCRILARELLQRVEVVPDEVVDLIVERSEGVPYFAEEIVHWFLDRGIIDHYGDPWRFVSKRYEETPLPTTLQHLLSTRLSSLREDQYKVLQMGSVFGRTFWTGGLEKHSIRLDEEILEGLQQRGFLELQPVSYFEGQQEWRFHHNLMRDVAYESILKRERPDLHKAAAGWLETQARSSGRLDEFAGILGKHAERAKEQDKAADWYLRAGERSWTQSATIEARQFLDRAIDLIQPDDRERRWQVLLDRDKVLSLQADTSQRDADTTLLLELASDFQDPTRIADAYYRRGGFLENTGDNQSALEASLKSVDAAKRAKDEQLTALAIGMSIACHTRLGQFHEAAPLLKEALYAMEKLEDETDRARILTNVAIYYTEIGDLSKAANLYEEQLEITHRQGNKAGEALGLVNLGYIDMQLGMFEKAKLALEKSRRLNEALGARRHYAYSLLNLALAHWRLGDCQSSQDMLEEARTEFEAFGDLFGQGTRLSYLGLCLELAEDNRGALEAFSDAKDCFEKVGLQPVVHDCEAGLARCSLANGHLGEAHQTVDRLWDYLHENGGAGLEFPIKAYLTCGIVYDALGEAEKSKAAVEAGYRELLGLADKISDAEWCGSFLENVPEHREIQQLWDRMAGSTAMNDGGEDHAQKNHNR